MDTGDAMPRTDFDRPDPLAGDHIMDATARLLAPRRVSLTPAAPRQHRPGRRSGSRAAEARQEGRREGRAGRARPPRAEAGRRPRQPERKQKEAPAPKARKEAGRRNRRHDRPRGLPPEPKRQTKDSTEQPSLMKPYYLDIGR